MTQITDQQLREIASRAATLDERVAALRRSAAEADRIPSDAAVERALSVWKRAVALGDDEAFERRLAWDGLDLADVRRALSPALDAAVESPPPWTGWLRRFVEEARELAREIDSEEAVPDIERHADAVERPFIELWVPMARAGRGALDREHPPPVDGVAPTVLHRFERQLIEDLGGYGAMAVYERFHDAVDRDGPEEAAGRTERYRSFVRGMLEERLPSFLVEHAALARQLARLVETWVETTGELLRRLTADRARLSDAFAGGEELGDLVAVDPALSDRHDGGRRVVALTFEGGCRVVYKPRDLGTEAAYHRFLSWLGATGMQPRPVALRVLDRPGYGWVELARQGSFGDREQVAEYYRAFGGLMCVAHVLRGADLHMENVVATRAGPVIVDPEMMIRPEPTGSGTSETTADVDAGGRAAIESSCLGTGLLSTLETDPEGELYDVGGARGEGGNRLPLSQRSWRSLRTDALHWVERTRFRPSLGNAVVLDGARQEPRAYGDEIVDGFARAYRFLMRRRAEILGDPGPLEAFSSCRSRILLRGSGRYGALLYVLAKPRYQCLGYRRSFGIDALNRSFAEMARRPRVWPLIADERGSLEALDIPRFSIPTTSVEPRSRDGETIEGWFARSGLSAVEARLRRLSADGLDRQVELLRWSLANPVGGRYRTEAPAAEATDGLRDHALWIGRELLERATERPDGGLDWDLPEDLRGGDVPSGTGDPGLYDGLAGVALFLVALETVTGDGRWREAADAVIRPLEEVLGGDLPRDGQGASIGGRVHGIEGWASTVYALSWIGRLSGRERYGELADRAGRRIDRDSVAGAVHYDVVGGLAGTALALLTLHEHARDRRHLETARAAGDRLLEGQVGGEGGGAWPSSSGPCLAGFAHGASGVAAALARLFRATGDERYRRASVAAFRFEESLLSRRRGNWRIPAGAGSGERDGPTWMSAWCHGAPGAGLARAVSIDALGGAANGTLREEIEMSMKTTARRGVGVWDHLCCGNLGRAEALFTVGRILGEDRYVQAGREIAGRVADGARSRGRFSLPSTKFETRVFVPGFFRGASGIGYQLLRMSEPDRLPSVLGLQSGVADPDSPTRPERLT